MLTRRQQARIRYFKQRFLLTSVMIAFLSVIIFFLLAVVLFAWYSRDLPSPDKVQRTSGFSTVFYDRNGKVIYELYKDQNRIPVTADQISKYVKEATVSIEDKNFYHEGGYSVPGIARALFSIIFRGSVQGGSTITQQLVKNAVLTSERSLPRKIKEFIISSEIDRKYTKDQILGMYLNEAPYGGTYWGIESASKGYFGKDAKDLTITEGAILAGIPQWPTHYSPFIGEQGAYIGRTKDVLRRMREDGYITSDQEKKSLNELQNMKFASPKAAFQAPHFIFYVKDQISQMFGEKVFDQGLQITTTLDEDEQKVTEQIVKEEVNKIKYLNATNGALVALDSKTGDILSMVGSYDYNDLKYGQYNVAIASRQPGSSIKPVTYALAFEKGYTPSTVLMDVKTIFPVIGSSDYTPVNYDGKFHGPIQIRFALGNSMNIPAVKLLAMVGLHDFMQKAYDMGLDNFQPTQQNMSKYGLAITLGGAESDLLHMTNMYSDFARGGTRKDFSSILEIKDYKGNVIYKRKDTQEKRVLSAGSSFLISHILSDNNARAAEFGLHSYLVVPGKTVAVKTGTTDDKRDNWAIGYTKDITVGVWVGNNDNSPMNQKIASGETGASPIWQRAMKAFLSSGKYKDGIMDKPDTVNALQIDSFLGGLPKDGYPNRSEYFIKGTEPKDISPYYQKLKISKNNGKLANDLEIKLGQYDEKDYIVITENDPVSTDRTNRWQQGINEWADSQGDDKFKGPRDVSDSSADSVVVSIKVPGDKTTVTTGDHTVPIQVRLTSLSAIKNTKIFLNGNQVQSIDGDNKDVNATLTGINDGAYILRVVSTNDKDKSAESSIQFGVNTPWDFGATPTPTPH